jgi:hypothetical protein
MNTNIRPITFNAALGFTLSCLMLLFSGSLSKLAAQANLPLEGVFSSGNWSVRLDDKSGTGVFTAVGSSSRKIGESFLKVSARSGYNTWRVRAFDRTFSTVQESEASIKGDALTIRPKTGPAYVMARARSTASTRAGAANGAGTAPGKYAEPEKLHSAPAESSHNSDKGCIAVQCHSVTKAGNRCRRTTTNCSGKCWQH